MAEPNAIPKDDPRQLRLLFERAAWVSRVLKLPSVFVGIAADEGDLLARDFLDFLEAELRVEDRMFRMLRERAVLLLTDTDVLAARRILERIASEFSARFAPRTELPFQYGYFGVMPGQTPTVKDVLPMLFSQRPS